MSMSVLGMGNRDGEGRGGSGFDSLRCSYSVSSATLDSTTILSATRHREFDRTSFSRTSVCTND